MAHSRLDDVSGLPTFSAEAHEMLRVLGKNHLRDVTDDEWLRFATQHTGSEMLCAEYWRWHCPDQKYLELISGKEGPEAQVEHWESVRRATADRHVQAHALSQIKLLQN